MEMAGGMCNNHRMPASILIVDDEKHTREGLRSALEEHYEIFLAADAAEAFNLLAAEPFDVVLTDLKMPGQGGMKVVEKALGLPRPPIVIMMTAYGSVETAVEAMKRGAYDFLTKPVSLEKLELLVRRALQERRVSAENVQLHERLDKQFQFEAIIGHSAAIHQLVERIRLVAPSRATVLLQGETGTGKELAAQAIHQNSPRARGPFMAVHCAALPATLLESELFGYEKGAFTGAMERRAGRFESADGGTLFLDEVGEIDASTQVKLLRFLETRSFERLGSAKPVAVDVRLVVATNRDLETMVKTGDFRDDLFFRLNVVRLVLPPLRERTEDIPVLLDHFLRLFAQENHLPTPIIEPSTLALLQRYAWPGNIRELRNFAENAVVLHHGQHLSPHDLDARFSGGANAVGTIVGGDPGSGGGQSQSPSLHPLSMTGQEKRILQQALLAARGNRTEAARILGISRRTLHRKLLLWPEIDFTSRGKGEDLPRDG